MPVTVEHPFPTAKCRNFRTGLRPFFSFDVQYVTALKNVDPATEEHFARYFGDLIDLKLRGRVRSRQMIENIRQETLVRVLETLRVKNALEHPERLGAFVLSVCRFVTYEHVRAEARYCQPDPEMPEPSDERCDPDAPLVQEECKRHVREVLNELSDRDRLILSLVFLEDIQRSEVCQRLGIDDNYLRVALFRAKSRFREKWLGCHRAA
jgi:RNA polymerase sigma-70 factor, ECF subfamily